MTRKQLVYFARDFLLDRFGRFFSLVRLRLIFGRPELADLGVGLDEFLMRVSCWNLRNLGHFALGLVYGGGRLAMTRRPSCRPLYR